MKKMTVRISLVFALSLLILTGSSQMLYAQTGKGKGNSGQKKEVKVQDKQNQKSGQDKVKENQGNAYGKNKGDLSGKEFGQARSEDARLNKEKALADRKKELKKEQKKLKKEKKEKKISEADFKARKEKLDKEQKELEEEDN